MGLMAKLFVFFFLSVQSFVFCQDDYDVGHWIGKQSLPVMKHSLAEVPTNVTRKKRGIAAITVGMGLVVGATDVGLSIGNIATDGAMYYPSIKKNKGLIKKFKESIKSKKSTLESGTKKMHKVYADYSKSLTHFNTWIDVIQQSLGIYRKLESLNLLADIDVDEEELEAAFVGRQNITEVGLYISQKVTMGVKDVINSVYVLRMLKYQFTMRPLYSTVMQFGLIGSLRQFNTGFFSVSRHILRTSFFTFSTTAAVFSGVGIVLSAASITLGVFEAKEKMERYELQRKDLENMDIKLDLAIANVTRSISNMNSQLDLIVKGTNQVLGNLQTKNKQFKDCTTSRETVADDTLELGLKWNAMKPHLEQVDKMLNQLPNMKETISTLVNVMDTESIFNMWISILPDNENDIIDALNLANAVLPTGTWTDWEKEGTCSEIANFKGKQVWRRICNTGSCLGQKSKIGICESSDKSCRLPKLLSRCRISGNSE